VAVARTDQRLLENGEAVQCASLATARGVAAVMTRTGILHNHVSDVGGAIVAARWRRRSVLDARDRRQAMLRAAQLVGAGTAREAIAAPAGLLRTRTRRSTVAHKFQAGIRSSCTPHHCRAAKPRASLAIETEEAWP